MVFPKRLLLITSGVLILALILIYFVLMNPKKNRENNNDEDFPVEKKKLEEAPIPVKVVKAKRDKLIIRLKSPGQAVCKRIITVKAEVSGIIEELLIDEGKKVKEGDLLVKLNDEKYRLQLREAESRRLEKLSRFLIEGEEYSLSGKGKKQKFNKEKIEKEYQKALSLYKQGLISEKEFEKAKRNYELMLIESGEKREEIRASVAGLTQAELEVKRAQMELEKTQIKAPFSGVITNIKVSPKEHVQAGQELFTLVDLNSIYVEAKILESEIGKIRKGREVNIRFTGYPSKIFKGYVKAISPIVDPEEKTCKILIDVANPTGEIKPGMHAEVEIAADIYEDRLIIPREAILVRGGRKLAFVVENGLAKWRYIKIGLENERYAEVLEGINEGEFVIVEGHFTLAHDAKVKIVD